MNFITGKDRHQIEFRSLEDNIVANNPVRFIDAFVDKLELDKLGFVSKILKAEGEFIYQPTPTQNIHLWLF